MRQRHATLVTLLAAALLAGCATPYGRARTALAEERYEEAASGFEEILTRHPDRLDALIGLGKARYKLGAFDDAITALTRAAARAPKSETDEGIDRKSTRLNSSHSSISYAVFCLKKKKRSRTPID